MSYATFIDGHCYCDLCCKYGHCGCNFCDEPCDCPADEEDE